MHGSTTVILEFTEICQIKDKKKDFYIRHFIFVNLDTFIMTLPEIGSHLASSSLSKVSIPDIYLNIQYVLKKIRLKKVRRKMIAPPKITNFKLPCAQKVGPNSCKIMR